MERIKRLPGWSNVNNDPLELLKLIVSGYLSRGIQGNIDPEKLKYNVRREYQTCHQITGETVSQWKARFDLKIIFGSESVASWSNHWATCFEV